MKSGVCIVLGLCALAAVFAAEPLDDPHDRAKPVEVELRGKVVCLPEEMHRLYGAALDDSHEHLYGFKSDQGRFYTILRTRFSEMFFSEPPVRERELMFKARLFPESQVIEVTSGIRSMRGGAVHDLYYYCLICEIFAVAPGPCECCQQPLEWTEKPIP
jgi:hypothetical protein